MKARGYELAVSGLVVRVPTAAYDCALIVMKDQGHFLITGGVACCDWQCIGTGLVVHYYRRAGFLIFQNNTARACLLRGTRPLLSPSPLPGEIPRK